MTKDLRRLIAGVILLAAFVLWTVAVCFIDVQVIGPCGSSVGFATVNGKFHSLTGVCMPLYMITDWLGLVPVAIGFAFAIIGLIQLIKRKSLLKVDRDILALGVFYVGVIVAYLAFEKFAINYRPVLINGYLEASYPSSTTLLVLCVIPTAVLQVNKRVENKKVKAVLMVVLAIFAAFTVIGRLISGVHWLTDIIGGIILSAALTVLYSAAV